MNSDIEEIKARLNIVDVLRDYIRLEKAGANWRALCPFHNEKSPSFMVSEDKQMWHCFGCQKGGDVFAFIMEIEGLEFKEALKQLAEKAGVELKKTNPKLAAEKSKTLEILELATKFYETQMWKGDGRIKIIDYLKGRGLQDETIKDFRLGYAPRGWTNLLNFLAGRGYRESEIEKTGLLVKKDQGGYYDRFRDRVMFPIADTNGKVVGFTGRVAPGGDESQAKYVNTPETEVYHKSRILYGIDKARQAMRQGDSVLLVEGNMDVIASSQAGIKNTVAVSGTALTPEQINIIKRYTDKIKMFFDMDQAGEAATKKSLKLAFAQDMSVAVVELPEGKDAADLARKNPAELLAAVERAKPAMEYFFQKVMSKFDRKKVEDKKKIAAELLEMIGQLASQIEKGHWIKKLGAEIETEEAVLTDMLKKATLKERFDGGTHQSAEPANFSPQKKSEILARELAGLLLVHGEAWKRVAAREDTAAILAKDSLLSALAAHGESAEYDFEKFLKTLDKEDLVNKAEQFYFEKKYRLDLNNSLEEIILDDPLAEAEKIIREIRKEMKREELIQIIEDLKIAERNQDKEAANFLRNQVKIISGELNS